MNLDDASKTLRLAILEAFWQSSELDGAERQRNVSKACDEASSQIPESIREEALDQVLQELSSWDPPEAPVILPASDDKTSETRDADGAALNAALTSVIRGELSETGRLTPYDAAIVRWARRIYEHVRQEWKIQRDTVKQIAGATYTSGWDPVRSAAADLITPEAVASGEDAALRAELQGLEDTWGRIQLASRNAAGHALRKLLGEFCSKAKSDSSADPVTSLQAMQDFCDKIRGPAEADNEELLRDYYNDFLKKEVADLLGV